MANQGNRGGDMGKSDTQDNRSSDQKNQGDRSQDTGRTPGGGHQQQPGHQGGMREPGRKEGGGRPRHNEPANPDEDRSRRGDQADGKR